LSRLAFFLSLALVRPLAAQTVQGVLLAEDGETPLAGARVQLVGLGDRTAAQAVTDAAGRFTLSAAQPGMYRVRAVPPGGAAILFSPVTLAAGELRELEFQAHPPAPADSVFALAPVTATAQQRRELLERHGFYQRQHVYPGRFLTHDQFVQLHGLRVVEKILDLGLFMEPHGAEGFSLYRVYHGGRCYVAVYVDGVPVGDQPLILMKDDEVAAVEYYTRDDIPAEFNPYPGDPNWRCGSVVIWTQPPGASR
jgi:hypothetical protein